MNTSNENAPAGTRALRNKAWNGNYKRLPSYGKALLELRRAGKMPAKRVVVTFSWNIGRAYPRIVLADDTPPEMLEFGFLAGLSVQIVYHKKDAHRINAIAGAILRINPSCLITFGLDLVETGDAMTVIKPFEFTQIAEAA